MASLSNNYVTFTTTEDSLLTSIPPSPPRFNQLFLVRSIVLSVMFLVSLAGNFTVLVQLVCRSGRTQRASVTGHRRGGNSDRRSVNSIGASSAAGSKSSRLGTIELLVGNLAASDLFVTFFCNMTEAVWVSTVQWYAGNVGCKVVMVRRERRVQGG